MPTAQYMAQEKFGPQLPEESTNPVFLEKLKEKKEPSLGELNPLLFPPDFSNPESLHALENAIIRTIDIYQGQQPVAFATTFVETPHGLSPRMLIRFETRELNEKQVRDLEEIVNQTYGEGTRGRKSSYGSKMAPTFYPGLTLRHNRGDKKTKTEHQKLLGWYMGLDPTTVSPSHIGLLVFRDLEKEGMAAYLKREDPKNWFFVNDLVTPQGKPIDTKYVVEIREASLYQTDLVEFATQISAILGTGKPIENKRLKYEIYNDLNRLGIKKTLREDISGLDEEIDRVERVLILPLANLEASSGIELTPGSVLLVGVPGTGKTYIVEHFLQKDTGVFLLPIDPKQLAMDLNKPPEKRYILPRITQVFDQTQIPVVIHLDDVENIAQNDQEINSTLLNMMAGVRESGFYAIASTNYPEKLSPQLLQPQRFGELVYFKLPSEQVRRGVLEIHATKLSRELDIKLFESETERNNILDALAKITDDFTPRYLAEICTEAKSFYLQRVAQMKKISFGMTEKDLKNQTFTVEDWGNAYERVSLKYDKVSTQKRDKLLKEFVKSLREQIGFIQEHQNERGKLALTHTIEEIAASKVESSTTSPLHFEQTPKLPS